MTWTVTSLMNSWFIEIPGTNPGQQCWGQKQKLGGAVSDPTKPCINSGILYCGNIKFESDLFAH